MYSQFVCVCVCRSFRSDFGSSQCGTRRSPKYKPAQRAKRLVGCLMELSCESVVVELSHIPVVSGTSTGVDVPMSVHIKNVTFSIKGNPPHGHGPLGDPGEQRAFLESIPWARCSSTTRSDCQRLPGHRPWRPRTWPGPRRGEETMSAPVWALRLVRSTWTTTARFHNLQGPCYLCGAGDGDAQAHTSNGQFFVAGSSIAQDFTISRDMSAAGLAQDKVVLPRPSEAIGEQSSPPCLKCVLAAARLLEHLEHLGHRCA